MNKINIFFFGLAEIIRLKIAFFFSRIFKLKIGLFWGFSPWRSRLFAGKWVDFQKCSVITYTKIELKT